MQLDLHAMSANWHIVATHLIKHFNFYDKIESIFTEGLQLRVQQQNISILAFMKEIECPTHQEPIPNKILTQEKCPQEIKQGFSVARLGTDKTTSLTDLTASSYLRQQHSDFRGLF